ncbi:MAG: response regulator [Magnetococcales bacterium]|nr:response regulator [Magnetococcales bacterium]
MATILVIESNHGRREALRYALRKEGHEVIATSSGHEGLLLFNQMEPDAVILDMLVQDISGIMVILELGKRGFSKEAIIPLIDQGALISAEQMLAMTRAFGVKRALVRLFTSRQLLDQLHDLLAETAVETAHHGGMEHLHTCCPALTESVVMSA